MSSFTYLAIDLKSFYASVECVERGLDPMTTNLVVADKSRTEKTICLAVSPSLKAYGIPGRARLFEVQQKVAAINRDRLQKAPGHRFTGASFHDPSVKLLPGLALDYVVDALSQSVHGNQRPNLSTVSHYVAPEDIPCVFHRRSVYGHHPVFAPVWPDPQATGPPHPTGRLSAHRHYGHRRHWYQLVPVQSGHGYWRQTHLARENGVRIAELDEDTYRRTLWTHRPLTDFWRVRTGIRQKLEENGLYTMGGHCPLLRGPPPGLLQ